jgi:hypothetical protein
LLASLIGCQENIGGLEDQQSGIDLLASTLPQCQQFAACLRFDRHLTRQQLGHGLATCRMIGHGLTLCGHGLLCQITAGFARQ